MKFNNHQLLAFFLPGSILIRIVFENSFLDFTWFILALVCLVARLFRKRELAGWDAAGCRVVLGVIL
jgi:hypothetical protein